MVVKRRWKAGLLLQKWAERSRGDFVDRKQLCRQEARPVESVMRKFKSEKVGEKEMRNIRA